MFKAHPEAGPGWLTKNKRAMVSEQFRGAVSVLLGFHEQMRVNAKQAHRIKYYSRDVLSARKGLNTPNFWNGLLIRAPVTVVSDVLHAFIGAISIDSNYDKSVIDGFFDTHIKPHLVDMKQDPAFANQHPSTILANKLTEIGCQQWGWETGTEPIGIKRGHAVFAALLIHGIVFTASPAPPGAYGLVHSARNLAAKAALQKLDSMGPEELCELCDCPKSHETDGKAMRKRRRKE
jgi:endoribonuclease Dicer